jgi:hypothetical protein
LAQRRAAGELAVELERQRLAALEEQQRLDEELF